MALPRGATLHRDRYQVQKLLARGGFGFIYLALDKLSGQQIVLKELIPALISDTDAVRRFTREGRTLQRIKHPHIVRMETMFKENGNHYLVLEYLNGGSLAEWIEQGHRLPVHKAAIIVLALCNAVHYLHEMGITHCDLQPGNILFDANGQPKLIDLGIAHISDALVHRPWHTERDLAIGTVFYMAPEQLDGVRNDPRVDLYALGALLYQMLAGHHYLDFDMHHTPGARADNVGRVRTEMPASIPDVPAEINKIIMRALSKKPADRHSNVRAFADELAQVILPYLPPAEAVYLTSTLGVETPVGVTVINPAGFDWKSQNDEWPRWVWPALVAVNLGVMLLIGILIFFATF